MDAPNNNNAGLNGNEANTSSQNANEMNPQRLRRLMMNREYAQRCRQRKQEYLNELIRRKDAEEAKVASLFPQVDFYRKQVVELQNENATLRQKINQLEIQASTENEEIEKLKAEKDMLIWMDIIHHSNDDK
ncbi:hypothetical protein RND81_06G204300 [Saponaria officinalis]|uniref:BZIP domain-containing protein n=1 Tax=Saponaria officinalis TaxID=3572 RepID=A0AAW1KDV9_SAPOF